MIKHLIYAFILLLALASCNTGIDTEAPATRQEKGLQVATFPIYKGYGYSIFLNEKEYIRQLYIPAIEGKYPFATEHQARETAIYVISKLKNQEGPSISKEELVKLKVIDTAFHPLKANASFQTE